MTKLQALSLWKNRLSGQVPTWLGSRTGLRTLNLAGNQFTGTIPAELGNLTNVNQLWLAHNQLTGTIPVELGNLTNVTELHIDDNQLTGTIPTELANLSGLRQLFLANNQLTGCIPAGLRDVAAQHDIAQLGLTDCGSATDPGAPTGLTATSNGKTRIDLSWSAPSDDGGVDITGYRIEVSTNSSNWSDLESNTDSTSTSYSHTGLTAGSTRHYRVSAINSVGTGRASDTDSATTDSAPNPDPTPSPATKAVTGSITSCEGEQVAPGIDSYRITIEGTVTANRAVENVTVEGTLNGDFVGIDIVGDMAAGETAYFTITGYVSESVGRCGADVEWLEIN